MVGPLDRARENVTEIVSVSVTGIWLAALFTGQDWWLPFMLVGYVVVVPLVALSFGDSDAIDEWWDDGDVSDPTEPEEASREDPIETLRERYARGELTDAEFERRLERLIETENGGTAREGEMATDGLDEALERE